MGVEHEVHPDDYVKTLIRVKARQLLGRYGFTRSDQEDIEQELALAVHVKLHRYDPARAKWTTFIAMVVDRSVASLIRSRRAVSRGHQITFQSLDEPPSAIGGPCVSNIGCGVDFASAADTRIDMQEALAALPAPLRQLADLVISAGINEAARATGRTRESVRHALRKLRQHLAARGLDDT